MAFEGDILSLSLCEIFIHYLRRAFCVTPFLAIPFSVNLNLFACCLSA